MHGQADREKAERQARAFNASIYLLLGVPAALIGGLATFIVMNVRARERQARHAAAVQSRDEAETPSGRS